MKADLSVLSRATRLALCLTAFSLPALQGCNETVETGINTNNAEENPNNTAPCAQNDQCDDGIFCNGTEVCDPNNAQADADGCVTTSNAPETNTCQEATCLEEEARWDITNTCEEPECTRDSDCADLEDSECSRGVCQEGQCRSVAAPDGSPCSENEPECVTHECRGGSCASILNHDSCVDDLLCNGLEACDPYAEEADERGCIPGVAPQAEDDGIACTVSTCDEESQTVSQTPGEDCECTTPGEPCEMNAPADACTVFVCSDNLTCEPQQAEAGTSCDDGISCTSSDTCNESGDCVGNAIDALCDDALFCNGTEFCAPLDENANAQGCIAGVPPQQPDGLECTRDVCNENTDSFEYIPGEDCGCAVDADCVPENANPCFVYTCGDDFACQSTPGNNGASCDDGVSCTTNDACNEGQCQGSVSHDACNNGLFCDGAETCNPSHPNANPQGCLAGTAPNIDDGVDCTTDSCEECPPEGCANNEAGVIVHAPTDTCECVQDQDCQGLYDDQPCIDGACQDHLCAPVPREAGASCDDGISCTTNDACNEDQECAGAPSDDLCSDDLFCNGAETCNLALGCQPGTDPLEDHPPQRPCAETSCNEDTDEIDVDMSACGECDDVNIYQDSDEDGYGDDTPVLACLASNEAPEAGYSRDNGDCALDDPFRHPNAQGVCGDNVDDDCDGQDEACPASQPSALNVPEWNCVGAPPDNVIAWAHFPTEDDYFTGGGCFIFFEGIEGEFYSKRVGFQPRRSNRTCPSPGGSSYDVRMYAHTTLTPASSCPELELIVHGPNEFNQKASTDCRKFLSQITSFETLTYLGNGEDFVRRRMALYPTVEVSCSPYDGFWRQSFYHSSLMETEIEFNPSFGD